ncbi:hypothetical protein Hanom_Chr06g00539191 [Helianthus anomalus]
MQDFQNRFTRQQNKPSFCLCPLYKHTQNSYRNPAKFTAHFLQETMELQVPQVRTSSVFDVKFGCNFIQFDFLCIFISLFHSI